MRMESKFTQIFELLVLAVPIACIARTVVYEEIFREPREWCQAKSKACQKVLQRKFFYLFTCEYCFSHYVTLAAVAVTHFKLLFDDWRGYIISFFSLVFIANVYMNLYARIRVDITHVKKSIEVQAKTAEAKEREIRNLDVELERMRG